MRDTRIDRPDTLVMKLTSRSHPILGEHLGHFGAFLAAPFREYDFYVGMYDGLYFVANEYTCVRRPDRRACVAEIMGRVLSRPPIPLGPVAPSILARLYAKEFGSSIRQAALATIMQSLPAVTSAKDSARLAVLNALHDAQASQYTRNRADCGNPPLSELILCQNQFSAVLDAFREAPEVKTAVKAWADECRQTRDANCQAANDLMSLVDDPLRYASRQTDRIIARLRAVEHQLHMEAERGEFVDSSFRTRNERLDSELIAVMLQSVYQSAPLRRRYGFELSGTSAPRRWVSALPYYFGGGLGTAGWEIGYRPMLNLNSHFALTVPLTARWRPARVETPTNPRELQVINYLGAGGGLAVRGVFPRVVSLIIPEFGVSAQGFGSITDGIDGTTWVGEFYSDFALVIGRLRLSLRHTQSDDRLFFGGRTAFSAGVADVNGYAYWLGAVLKDRVWPK
jgi:hypothetical protein